MRAMIVKERRQKDDERGEILRQKKEQLEMQTKTE
jgi:hypothetical protein